MNLSLVVFGVTLALASSVLGSRKNFLNIHQDREEGSANMVASSRVACLDCHGPFDSLVSAAPNLQAPNGGKINPHRYVPHTSKDVPECTKCHVAHPVPLGSKEEKAPKADVRWCYDTCHHQQDFTPCSKCHI